MSNGPRRVLDFHRSDDIPFLARTTFRLERWHMTLWGMFAGLIEGRTSRIVAAKTFAGSDLLVTFVVATPMLANLLSLVWSVIVRGMPRTRLFLWLAMAAIASFAAVGLVSRGWLPWGGWVFAALLALAHIFLAGIVNVRTSMWSLNYPQGLRARITGRLQGLRFLMAMIAGIATALLFNHDPSHYHWVYPLIAAVALASLAPARRMSVRGERRALRHYREHQSQLGTMSRGVLGGLRESIAVLRNDRDFARYCTAQYMLGSAWLMMEAVLTIVITKRLGLDFKSSYVLLELIPSVVLLVTLSATAHYFDRVGVLRFRVLNSLVWLLAMSLALIGMITAALPDPLGSTLAITFLALSAVVIGCGRAGGAIAWNLGHLHFASGHKAELYMGIHVALTGVRGVAMPFVGLLALRYLGWGAAGVACVLAVVGTLLFHRLAKEWHGRMPVADAPIVPDEEAAL